MNHQLSKVCPCGQIFNKPSKMSFAIWNKRIYCSMRCQQLYRWIKISPIKYCENCGKLLIKHKTESFSRFENRRTCGKVCGGKIEKIKVDFSKTVRNREIIRLYQTTPLTHREIAHLTGLHSEEGVRYVLRSHNIAPNRNKKYK